MIVYEVLEKKSYFKTLTMIVCLSCGMYCPVLMSLTCHSFLAEGRDCQIILG